MARPKKQRVVMKHGDGHLRVIERDLPEMRPGSVLIKVGASLVSPGSELASWRTFAALRETPDPDASPTPFGYSNTGVVIEAAEGAEEFKPGDRVAAVGGNYASHSDYAVVPHNLCVALPDEVTFVQGSYAMLAATAVHAIRRAEPQLGEWMAVAGMGLVGQLTGQFLRMNGCFVIGWDSIPQRLETARGWGIDAVCNITEQDPAETTRAFTGGFGLDGAIVAFGGDGNAAIRALQQSLKVSPDTHQMGRIVVVGNVSFAWPLHAGANAEIRQAGRTGPGYHDGKWESGEPYPPVFMRWTTRTNLELCMRLIGEGRLDVDCLTTHTIPFDDVDAQITAALESPDDMLGVVFTHDLS